MKRYKVTISEISPPETYKFEATETDLLKNFYGSIYEVIKDNMHEDNFNFTLSSANRVVIVRRIQNLHVSQKSASADTGPVDPF